MKIEGLLAILLLFTSCLGGIGFVFTQKAKDDAETSLRHEQEKARESMFASQSELIGERAKSHTLARALVSSRARHFDLANQIYTRFADCKFLGDSEVELCNTLMEGRPVSYRCDVDGCHFECGGDK